MESLGTWLFFIAIVVFTLIYRHLSQKFNYWSDRAIKGPKPIPIFGNILDIFITPQPIVDCKWLTKYGKIYGYFMGKSPILTISEPELIKLVLVKDFHLFSERRHQKSLHPILSKCLVNTVGNDWKRIRSIARPLFKSDKLKQMYPLIRECLKEFINYLETYAKNGKAVDMKNMYGKYTMEVIATCALANKSNSYQENDSPFVANARKLFNLSVFRLIPVLMFPSFVNKFFNFGNFEESNEYFLNSTRNILKMRAKSNKTFNDFIQLLMNEQKDINNEDKECNHSYHVNEGEEELEIEKKALNINIVDKHLTEDEILAQALNFLLAGYETTATTLTLCSYELALNPDIQQKLYEEVINCFDSNDDIDYEILMNLQFLDAVISETLRLHSPSLRVARIASTDYKLGNSGITIEKGLQIEVPVYAIHHSEEFFTNADQFNPDRFLPQNRQNIKPYTYLPFGGGPRHCIGFRFSLLEVKLGLAHIIRKYKIMKTCKTELKHQRFYRLNTPKHLILSLNIRDNK